MLGIASARCAGPWVFGAVLAGGAVLFAPATASAHFILNVPACWESQDTLGSPQKNGPCAAIPNASLEPDVVGIPSDVVTGGILPGSTVSITVTVTIAHPGWYRVSLVQGTSATQSLTSLPDPPITTTCTATIINNPVWSPTQPVIADNVPTGSRTFQVTIPQNAVCTDAAPCTLQVVMVMTDHTPSDCFYHHCADISSGVGTAADGGRIISSSSSSSSGGGAADASVRVDASGPKADASTGTGGESSSSSGSSGATSSSSSSGSGATSSSGGSSSGSAGNGSSSGASGTPTGTATSSSSSSSGADGHDDRRRRWRGERHERRRVLGRLRDGGRRRQSSGRRYRGARAVRDGEAPPARALRQEPGGRGREAQPPP